MLIDQSRVEIIRDLRSTNNCYLMQHDFSHVRTIIDDLVKLLQDRLGHINHQNLMKLTKLCVVRGLPNLSKNTKHACVS